MDRQRTYKVFHLGRGITPDLPPTKCIDDLAAVLTRRFNNTSRVPADQSNIGNRCHIPLNRQHE